MAPAPSVDMVDESVDTPNCTQVPGHSNDLQQSSPIYENSSWQPSTACGAHGNLNSKLQSQATSRHLQSNWREDKDCDGEDCKSTRVSTASRDLSPSHGLCTFNSFEVDSPPSEDDRQRGHYMTNTSTMPTHEADPSIAAMNAIVEEEEDSDGGGVSSTMLGTEAERILEHAKMRLTHMEGNLTRARTSLGLNLFSTPTLNEGTNNSHKYVFGHHRSLSKTESRVHTSLAGALLRRRLSQDFHIRAPHAKELRDVYSSLLQKRQPEVNPGRPYRSLSALASTSVSLNSIEAIAPKSPNSDCEPFKSSFTPLKGPAFLSPLKLDGGPKPSANKTHAQSALSKPHIELSRLQSLEDFNNLCPSRPPSRSQSQLDIRGPQNQTQDLRTKISTPGTHAEVDQGMRRHSLHNPSLPAALITAEQWYTNGSKCGTVCFRQNRVVNSGPAIEPVTDTSLEENKQMQSLAYSSPANSRFCGIETAHTDGQLMVELYDDLEDFSATGSGASTERLPEMLENAEQEAAETFPPGFIPGTVRHEDRFDAFDYEHFILHSALGNYSGSKSRRESYSSVGSTEARGPSMRHMERLVPDTIAYDSDFDFISKSATFATADRGEFDIQGYENRRFNGTLCCEKRDSVIKVSPGGQPSAALIDSLIRCAVPESKFVSNNTLLTSADFQRQDIKLLELLAHTLGCVGFQLLHSSFLHESSDSNEQTVILLRRRLNAARQILEGELDI
ncbi:hypothetical protein PRK78_007115 [Emydomyces testavorans]|uniref:Uncharacterized protein n=1 Tax=Emydomyces testavorans TaxID=2070801 RepID=A0AAF0DNP9_9EURO|nr:hypothetical protein PRK78_007115 [Emydomyces testavorans]